jgi:hypothetical protein
MTASVPHFHDGGLTADTCQVWRNHDAIPRQEDVEGFVALVSCTGYAADGREYRRTRRLVSHGLTVGELRRLLHDELLELNVDRQAPRP